MRIWLSTCYTCCLLGAQKNHGDQGQRSGEERRREWGEGVCLGRKLCPVPVDGAGSWPAPPGCCGWSQWIPGLSPSSGSTGDGPCEPLNSILWRCPLIKMVGASRFLRGKVWMCICLLWLLNPLAFEADGAGCSLSAPVPWEVSLCLPSPELLLRVWAPGVALNRALGLSLHSSEFAEDPLTPFWPYLSFLLSTFSSHPTLLVVPQTPTLLRLCICCFSNLERFLFPSRTHLVGVHTCRARMWARTYPTLPTSLHTWTLRLQVSLWSVLWPAG